MTFRAKLTSTQQNVRLFVVKVCGEPTVPEFTVLDSCTADYNFESVCVYQCEDGYGMAPDSDRSIQCTADETWDGTISQCLGASYIVVTLFYQVPKCIHTLLHVG